MIKTKTRTATWPLAIRAALRRFLIAPTGAIAAFFVCIPTAANAAFANYNSMLLGERAAGLGGAFTALYRDSSAVTFYNPAGLGFFNTLSASASASVYKKFDVKYGDVDQFTTASLRVNQGFFRGLPSATGSVFTDLAEGGGTGSRLNGSFSIVVPDHDAFSGEIRSTDTGVSLLTMVDESLWVGGGLGLRTSEDCSYGISLYYTARNYSRTVRERLLTGGTEATVMSEEKNILGNSIVAIFGFQSRFPVNENEWRFGVSFRPPGLQVSGTGSYFLSVLKTNPFSSSTVNLPHVATLTQVPAKLSAGLAWISRDRLTISADLAAYDETEYDDMTEPGTIRDHIQHHRVVNLNLGAEAALNPSLKLRFGAYTNFSSHPEPDSTATYRQGESVDQGGFSANVAIEPNDKFRFTFGGYYTGGRGQSLQLVNQRLTRVPKSQQVFTMLIGTAFTL